MTMAIPVSRAYARIAAFKPVFRLGAIRFTLGVKNMIL